jgi:hypothetical protein
VSTARIFAVAVLAGALTACHVRIATLTLAGTTAERGPASPTAPQRTSGVSCRWWVLGLPLGLPHIEEAVADALARVGSTGWLRDVEIDSVHPVYGPVGRHCYVVTGTTWTTGAR